MPSSLAVATATLALSCLAPTSGLAQAPANDPDLATTATRIRACLGGDDVACCWLREVDSPSLEALTGVAPLEEACAEGEADACANAALMLATGRGVARDTERALSRLDDACATGMPSACAPRAARTSVPTAQATVSPELLALRADQRGRRARRGLSEGWMVGIVFIAIGGAAILATLVAGVVLFSSLAHTGGCIGPCFIGP